MTGVRPSGKGFELRWRENAFAVALGASLLLADARVAVSSPIQLDPVEVDPPTLAAVGFALPFTGDTDLDASVQVEYRVAGSGSWKPALTPLRVRPEFADIARGKEFAGTIFDLLPDTNYEVRVTVDDPDGGGNVVSFTSRTRAMPPAMPATPNAVSVASAAQLQTALDDALPGDVITLQPGTYSGGFTIAASGTADNPIIVRGVDRDAVRIEGNDTDLDDSVFRVTGDYVTLEDVTLENTAGLDAHYVVRADSGHSSFPRAALTHFVLRRCRIIGRKGLRIWTGTNRDFSIYDNVFQGLRSWEWIRDSIVTTGTFEPDAEIRAAWSDDGMRVTGQGHAIFNNTFSGFGDSIKIHRETDVPNISIDYYRNDILWGADDGIELDDGYRNVRAWENRVSNTGTLMSRQPNEDSGGPAYALRNVGINQFLRPYKLNDGPSGVYLLHNTAVSADNYFGSAWTQFDNGAVDNFFFLNNVLVGLNDEALVLFDADLSAEMWDGNGYYPDGRFSMGSAGEEDSFAAAQLNITIDGFNGASFEANGRLLNGEPFATPLATGSNWETWAAPQTPVLSASSNAVDAALPLANVNAEHAGAGPDIGALELGLPEPQYGAGFAYAPSPGTDTDAGSGSSGGLALGKWVCALWLLLALRPALSAQWARLKAATRAPPGCRPRAARRDWLHPLRSRSG